MPGKEQRNGVSATELAEKPGYSKSTHIKYLKKAENKVMKEIFGRIT
ncbi:MAG: helix-turn-helix domain-containing protein [Methanoregula sp.]